MCKRTNLYDFNEQRGQQYESIYEVQTLIKCGFKDTIPNEMIKGLQVISNEDILFDYKSWI